MAQPTLCIPSVVSYEKLKVIAFTQLKIRLITSR